MNILIAYCSIIGNLYTPKQYPANNVIVTYQNTQTITDEKGYFQLKIEEQQISGMIKYNLADQFQMEQYVQGCNINLGNVIIDNHQRISTIIQGCFSNINSEYKITAKYSKPTLLDIQQESQSQTCFKLEDQLMKLFIIEVFIKIESKGYYTLNICQNDICYDCECNQGISLFNTYQYDLKTLEMKPNYIPIQLNVITNGINQSQQCQLTLSCQQLGQITYIETHSNCQLQNTYNTIFKKDIDYTCALMALDQKQVAYKVFQLKQLQTIILTLSNNILTSTINSRILDQNGQGISDTIIKAKWNDQQIETQSDINGNFTLIMLIEKQCKISLNIYHTGYQIKLLQFTTPIPPFTQTLPDIILYKQQKYIDLEINIDGQLLTIFEDPINNANVIIQCQQSNYSSISNINGQFQFQFKLRTIGEQCLFIFSQQNFEQYQKTFYIGESSFGLGDAKFNNQVINSKLLLKFYPIILQIIIDADFDLFTGNVFTYLSKAQCNNNLANPLLNNTLNLYDNQFLTNSTHYNHQYQAYQYYQYEFTIQVGDLSKTAQVQDNGILNFGKVAQNNVKSKFYSTIIGQLMCNDTTIPQVDVSFYYLLTQKIYMNRTLTDNDGNFNLLVNNPNIQGVYQGFMEFSKEGYLSDDLLLTLNIEQANSTYNIGVINMIKYQ